MESTALRSLVAAAMLAGVGCADDESVGEQQSLLAQQRSVEEFAAAQGTFCTPDWINGGCFLMVPPVPNFFKWMQIDPRRCGMVDYAGVANRWLIGASGGAVDLGTEVTGAITERALNDGTSEVHVRLRTENALAWVVDGCDIASGALQFGHRAQDVLAGARPSLAIAELDVRYVDVAFGSPLRDVGQVLDFPHPGQGFKSARFSASADGELRAAYGVPEGTPGQAHFTLAALFFTGATYGSAMSDGVPIDRIDLNVTGH